MRFSGATEALQALVLRGILDPGDFLATTTVSVDVWRTAGPLRVQRIRPTRILGFLPYGAPEAGDLPIQSEPSTPDFSPPRLLVPHAATWRHLEVPNFPPPPPPRG